MKVLTVVGTRPEIIKTSRILARLDRHAEHVIVHTGQNRQPELRDSFLRDLVGRDPDHQLDLPDGPMAEQVGAILAGVDRLLESERPDRFFVLGDTNSALSAFVAARRRIAVYHLEAGNRCYDGRIAEEVNRRLVDHASDVLLAYTERSRQHLLREGFHPGRVFVVGNPIAEVLDHHAAKVEGSSALAELGLAPGGYLLATAHRQETVDEGARLGALLEAFARVAADQGVALVASVHPRTHDRLARAGLAPPAGVRLLGPQPFFDFVALQRGARAVLTDSGTVQEECCLLRVPCVVLRWTTERPELLDAGSCVLADVDPASVVRATRLALALPTDWPIPPEYQRLDVSATVTRLLLSYRPTDG